MNFRTKNPVTHIDVTTLQANGGLANGTVPTKQGIVTMTVGGYLFVDNGNGNQKIEAAYQYADGDGNILPTSNNNKLELDSAKVGSIDAISASLGNSGASFSEHFRADVKSYAMSEFAKVFNVDISDIEEI